MPEAISAQSVFFFGVSLYPSSSCCIKSFESSTLIRAVTRPSFKGLFTGMPPKPLIKVSGQSPDGSSPKLIKANEITAEPVQSSVRPGEDPLPFCQGPWELRLPGARLFSAPVRFPVRKIRVIISVSGYKLYFKGINIKE